MQVNGILYPAALLAIVLASQATAADQAALCEAAAAVASERQAIPPHLMQTLTITETGRSQGGMLRPWPWAINHAGQGHWFATAEEMLRFAEQLIEAGDRNFDVGCFQLNVRWHSSHFASLSDMIDPARNADYAALFLRQKYDDLGSWRAAVGAYHSQTEQHATAYLARFEAVYAQWSDNPALPAATTSFAQPSAEPSNSFPLLIIGNLGHQGSLVPMTQNPRRLIGASE